MKTYFRSALLSIREQEQKLTMDAAHVIQESRAMIQLLSVQLAELKEYVTKNDFISLEEEIEFFKEIKPELYGKLLFYNRVLRVESARPVEIDRASKKYFSKRLNKLENDHRKFANHCPFYRYYRSGDKNKDEAYFTRGNIHIEEGLHGYVFETDADFSTYYDIEIAHIMECDLLYEYLYFRVNNYHQPLPKITAKTTTANIFWTDSKNALIELIYALHASGSIGNGKMEIRKIVSLFQGVFNIQLGDVHHAFHRMKFRSSDKSSFIEKLKHALQTYMDKDLE